MFLPSSEDESDADENSEADTSDGTNDDISEDIQFYLCLLMNLLPSMERAYSQIEEEKQSTRLLLFTFELLAYVRFSLLGRFLQESRG